MFGFVTALTGFFVNALNFRGRATRGEFWWLQLTLFVVYVIAGNADAQKIIYMEQAARFGGTPNPALLATFWVSLLTLVPLLSLSARRLHDTGRSAFWMLISLVPLIGTVVLLIFYMGRSEPHTNKWGDPRDPEEPCAPSRPGEGAALVAPTAPNRKAKAANPWQGYAVLLEAEKPQSPEREAARKAEIQDYYRTRVLKQPSQA